MVFDVPPRAVVVLIIGHYVTAATTFRYDDDDVLVARNYRRQTPLPPPTIFPRYMSCAEGCGYVGSCSAFYHSPRVDRSEEDRREALPSQVEAVPPARRTFGGPRGRVPLRSRPGFNALAA